MRPMLATKGDHVPTGADWVQRDKALKNPYFGASMLACGSIKN